LRRRCARFFPLQNLNGILLYLIDSYMNEKDFLDKLSELALWERPMVGPNGLPSALKRSQEKLAEATPLEYDEDGELISAEPVITHNNSIGPVIKQLKPKTESCPDCGLVVQDRVVQIRFVENKIDGRMSRVDRCVACKKTRTPSGEFLDRAQLIKEKNKPIVKREYNKKSSRWG
jgi:hypothetical protein